MSAPAFTAAQLAAISPEAPPRDTCVVAGPGSGKTTVLVEYFRRLVAGGADPLRILAITFTEKAAGNMRKKLAEAFEDQSGIRASLERAWVSTVHGFCARLLRENAIFAGVDPEFYVSDEREAWRLQQESMAAAMSALFQERPEAMRALIRGLSSAELEEALLSAYDAMRGAGQTVADVAARPVPPGVTKEELGATIGDLRHASLFGWNSSQRDQIAMILEDGERIRGAQGALETLQAIAAYSGDLRKCKQNTPASQLARRMRDQVQALRYTVITEIYGQERELLLEILRRFDRIYRERKRSAGALDFADLEEYAVRLLVENRETRARLQEQFEHILMDEFQDTNGQQARLLELIRQPDRFYAVGDINQSIFGFRHAEPEVFREYRDGVERGGRRLVELVDNFRSRPEILLAVETVAAGAGGIEPRSLVAGREFAQSRAVCVDVINAPELAIEARWLARRIVELTAGAGRRFRWQDVAVLVRNTEVLGEFATAFDEAGIPYVVNRGKGFYDSREVKDLTHLLRVIANPLDELSMAAVLRSPLVQVSDEALLSLKAEGENLGVALVRLAARPGDPASDNVEKLTRFRQRLERWRLRREFVSFDRLLLAALDDCGYPAEPRAWANIEKFLAQAREASGRMSLDEFVEQVALMRADNLRERDAPPEDAADAVSIMTVHSAKGLEFPIVCVAALHKGVETSLPVVAFSRQYGLGARWRDPAAGEEKDDLFQHAIREEQDRREKQEGERLLYVAMTRAEEHLVLSFSGKKRLQNWAQTVVQKLDLDLAQARDEVLVREAPNRNTWQLRWTVADAAPELVRGMPAEGPERPEVELVDLPLLTERQDANATVTALAVFAKCPRAYYLGNALGFEGRPRKIDDAEELGAGDFGTQVHALLAGVPVVTPDPKAVAMAEVFRQSPLGRRAALATQIEREFDFLLAVEGLVLHGKIDLWFEEGGETVIVDYKTDRVSSVEAHQRAADYAMQLRLYALAVERITGRPPDQAWLHFLRPNTAIKVDLAPSLLDSPEQAVRDFLEAQNAGEFPLREGAHCQRCPFVGDLCPAGRPSGANGSRA